MSEMSFIQLSSGLPFFLRNPDISSIDVKDIAGSLSRLCRFTGHLRRDVEFYSVAEHSVLMADYAYHVLNDPELAFQALMHDAHEAYVGDMATPLKRLCSDYQQIEDLLQTAVLAQFEIKSLSQEVKSLDIRILAAERSALLMPSLHDWGLPDVEPLDVAFKLWRPNAAYDAFIDRFADLWAIREGWAQS